MNQPFITRIEQGCGSKTNNTCCKVFLAYEISHHLLQDNELEELLLLFYIYTMSFQWFVIFFLDHDAMPAWPLLYYNANSTFLLQVKKLPPTLFDIKIKITGFI
jgi:hypothetical protein